MQRMIVMPPGAPPAAVASLRTAIARVNADKDYIADAEKAFGFVPLWRASADTPRVAMTALSMKPEVRAFLTDYMKNLPSR